MFVNGASGEDNAGVDAATNAAFQAFLQLTQSGELHQTNTFSIPVQREVNGRVINRNMQKTVRRDASYAEIKFFTDSTCTEKLMHEGADGNLLHYAEQHAYHNSPINFPQMNIGPPYGVFCTGYAPVGQFRKQSCTLRDVTEKRDGCIQLTNPLSGKYWYDTAFAACKNPAACDSRKIDIVEQSIEVRDAILFAKQLLLQATIAQGLSIAIAVVIHFLFETLCNGNVFKHRVTYVFFILKNLFVVVAFALNVYLGYYLNTARIGSGQTVLEWLNNFIENECFDAVGTVILTETRNFVVDSATQMIVVGFIILVDGVIEDNISIVVEGTRHKKEKRVNEGIQDIASKAQTIKETLTSTAPEQHQKSAGDEKAKATAWPPTDDEYIKVDGKYAP